MTAREILLKHVNKGTSDRVKKLNEIVDWSMFIAAMEEYAEQQVKNLNIPAVSVAVCPKCKTKDTQVICCTCGHGNNIDDFKQTER
jgi:hypothetical protein